ncbi:hypothetical protein ACSQ67_002965 [Phaseolus vulgaris]
MTKRLPSRNNRTRGIKVKRILQIILLLCFCSWLIYQVKHSRDKKNKFVEDDAKGSVGTQTVYPTPKLGRKDLHEENHEHNEHEEKDDKHEVRVGDEEDESKSDEVQDERGGGDDESDQDQLPADIILDEEDEKEIESYEKENSSKEEENHNSHEAQEQQYKADDASSAVVTHYKVSLLVNPDANSEMNTKETRRNQNGSNVKIKEAELASVQSSNADLTTTFADSHSEAGTDLTIVIHGGSNNLTIISANTSFELNKAVIFSESNQTQKGTVNTVVTGEVKNVPTEGLLQGGSNRVSEENQLGSSNSAAPVELEKGDAAAGDSSDSHILKSVADIRKEVDIGDATATD